MLCPHLPAQCDIVHLETFAGCKSVTSAFRNAGQFAVSYELLDNPTLQDILSDTGYMNLIVQTLRVVNCGASTNPCLQQLGLSKPR